MNAVSTMLLHAPRSVVMVGVLSSAFALLTWLWLLRRVLRRVFAQKSGARGRGGMFLFLVSLPAALIGVAILSLAMTLVGYRTYAHKTRIAELQCIEIDPDAAPRHLRLYYVPFEANGTRGPTSTYALAGDACSVAGETLEFRTFIGALGINPAYAVTRVEGRGAAPTDKEPKTYDVGGSRVWLAAEQDGIRGPLGLLVESVKSQVVSVLPDRRAAYAVFVTPSGYAVDKRPY